MSVKVAVRVRPFNEREKGSVCCVKMDGPTTAMFNPNEADPSINQRTFTFDYSFWSHAGMKTDENGISVPDSPTSKYAD
jgi:kinesin family protein 1